jgi:hypothetical protein
MKKYLMIFGMAAFFGLTLSSCQSKNTPEYVADKFLTHLSNGEFEEASKYATEQTGQLLSMAAAFAGDMMEDREKHENLSCEIEGDKAKCTYTVGDEIDTIDLVKQDGNWLVHQDK